MLNTLRENIFELQNNFGIMLPDAKLVNSELQITAGSPIGSYGVYDIYPGTYLGREVWCKKLSYEDPDEEAMMVRAPFYRLVPSPNTTPTQRFRREIDIWSKLWKRDQEQHRSEGAQPRVLPLYGFYMTYRGATSVCGGI